jgi:hypothetical protein
VSLSFDQTGLTPEGRRELGISPLVVPLRDKNKRKGFLHEASRLTQRPMTLEDEHLIGTLSFQLLPEFLRLLLLCFFFFSVAKYIDMDYRIVLGRQ